MTFQTLISGCPIIEDLILNMYTYFSLHNVDLTVCGTLRILTDELLGHLISCLTLVERLMLHHCIGLKDIIILGNSLKSLLLDVSDRTGATFMMPNLVHFSYHGPVQLIFAFDAPNLLQFSMEFTGSSDTYPDTWYFDLIVFLSNIKFLKMALRIHWDQALRVPENIRNSCCSPLPNLKYLKVKISCWRNSLRDSELRDSLHWWAPSVETPEIDWIYPIYY